MQRETSANAEGGLAIRSQNVTQKTRKMKRWSGNKAKDVEIVDYHG